MFSRGLSARTLSRLARAAPRSAQWWGPTHVVWVQNPKRPQRSLHSTMSGNALAAGKALAKHALSSTLRRQKRLEAVWFKSGSRPLWHNAFAQSPVRTSANVRKFSSASVLHPVSTSPEPVTDTRTTFQTPPFGHMPPAMNWERTRLLTTLRPPVPNLWKTHRRTRAFPRYAPRWVGLRVKGYKNSIQKDGGYTSAIPPARKTGHFHDPDYHMSPSQRKAFARRLRRNPFDVTRRNTYQWSQINFAPQSFVSPKVYTRMRAQPLKSRLVTLNDRYIRIPSLARMGRSFAKHLLRDEPQFRLAGPLRELLAKSRYKPAWQLNPEVALARVVQKHQRRLKARLLEKDDDDDDPIDPDYLMLRAQNELEHTQFIQRRYSKKPVHENNNAADLDHTILTPQQDGAVATTFEVQDEDFPDIYPPIYRGYMHTKRKYMRARRKRQRQWSRVLPEVDPLQKALFRKWLLRQSDKDLAKWLVEAGVHPQENPVLTGESVANPAYDGGTAAIDSASDPTFSSPQAKAVARSNALKHLGNFPVSTEDLTVAPAPLEHVPSAVVESGTAESVVEATVIDMTSSLPTIHEREANLLPEVRQHIPETGRDEISDLNRLQHKDLLNDLDFDLHHDICESFWIFNEGAVFFEQLWRDIDMAQCEIMFETYNYIHGAVAEITLNKLKSAALRGVNVIMVFNAFVFRATMPSDIYHLQQCGIKILWYNRTDPSNKKWLHRNHRKLVVIDGCVAFLGGKNITDGARFAPSTFFSEEYYDMMIRLEGAAAIELRANFAEHIRCGFIDDPWAEAPRFPPAYFVPTDVDPNGMRWGYVEQLSSKEYRKLNGIVNTRAGEIFDDTELEMHERIFTDTTVESALLNDLRDLDYDIGDTEAKLRWLAEPYPLPATVDDNSELSQQFAVLEVPQSHFEAPRVYTHVYPERPMPEYIRARQLLHRSVPLRAFPFESAESRGEAVLKHISQAPDANVRSLAWWDEPDIGNVTSLPVTAEGLTEAAREPSMAGAGVQDLSREEARQVIREASLMKDVLPETQDPAIVSKILKSQLAEFPDLTTEMWEDVPISIFEINDMAGMWEFHDLLGHLMEEVDSTLTIVNPYFAPPSWLLDALKRLDERGVRINVVVSSRGQPISEVPASTQRFIKLLGMKNTLIHVMDAPSHVKMWIFDNRRVLFGTMNFDSLSMNDNAEIGIMIEDPNVVNSMLEVAQNMIEDCRAPTAETPAISEGKIHIALLVNYYLMTVYTGNRTFEANEEGQLKLQDWLLAFPWLRSWFEPHIEFSRNHMMLEHGFTFQHMVNLYGGRPTVRPIITPPMPSIGKLWRNIDLYERKMPWTFSSLLYQLQRIYFLRKWAKTGEMVEVKPYIDTTVDTSFQGLLLALWNGTFEKASVNQGQKGDGQSVSEPKRKRLSIWTIVKEWWNARWAKTHLTFQAMEFKQRRKRYLCALRPFKPFRGLKSTPSIRVIPWKRKARSSRRGGFMLPGERVKAWLERRKWWIRRDVELAARVRARMDKRLKAKQAIIRYQKQQYERMVEKIQAFRKEKGLPPMKLPRFDRPDHTMIEAIVNQSTSRVKYDGQPYLERLAILPPFTDIKFEEVAAPGAYSKLSDLSAMRNDPDLERLNSECREIIATTDMHTRYLARRAADKWDYRPLSETEPPASILHTLPHALYPSFASKSSPAHSPAFSVHNIDSVAQSRSAALAEQNDYAIGITIEPLWSKPTLSPGTLAELSTWPAANSSGSGSSMTGFDLIQTIAGSPSSKQRETNQRILRAEMAARKVRASTSKLHWCILRQCKQGRHSVLVDKGQPSRGHWNPHFYRYRQRLLAQAQESHTGRARTAIRDMREMVDFNKTPNALESGEMPDHRGKVRARRRYPVPSIAELLRMLDDPMITDHQYYYLVRLGMRRAYKSVLYCMRVLFRLRGHRARQDFVFNAMLQAAEEGRDLIAVTRAALRVKNIPREPLEQNAPATPYPSVVLAGMKLRRAVRDKERKKRPWFATLKHAIESSKGWQYLVARGWITPPDSFGEVRSVNSPVYTTAHASGRDGAFYYIHGGGGVTNKYMYPFKDEVDQLQTLDFVNTLNVTTGGAPLPTGTNYAERLPDMFLYRLVKGAYWLSEIWERFTANRAARKTAQLEELLRTWEQDYTRQIGARLKNEKRLKCARLALLRYKAKYVIPLPPSKRDRLRIRMLRVPIPPSLEPPATRVYIRPNGYRQMLSQAKRYARLNKRRVKLIPWILPKGRGGERPWYVPGQNRVFFTISRRDRLYNSAPGASTAALDVDADEGTRVTAEALKEIYSEMLSDPHPRYRTMQSRLTACTNDFDSAVVDARLIYPYRLISPMDEFEAENAFDFHIFELWQLEHPFYHSVAPPTVYDTPYQPKERWAVPTAPTQVVEVTKYKESVDNAAVLSTTAVLSQPREPSVTTEEHDAETLIAEPRPPPTPEEFEEKVAKRKETQSKALVEFVSQSHDQLDLLHRSVLNVSYKATPADLAMDNDAIQYSMGTTGRIKAAFERVISLLKESAKAVLPEDQHVAEADIISMTIHPSESKKEHVQVDGPLLQPPVSTKTPMKVEHFYPSDYPIPVPKYEIPTTTLLIDRTVTRLERMLAYQIRDLPVPLQPDTHTLTVYRGISRDRTVLVKGMEPRLPFVQASRRAVQGFLRRATRRAAKASATAAGAMSVTSAVLRSKERRKFVTGRFIMGTKRVSRLSYARAKTAFHSLRMRPFVEKLHSSKYPLSLIRVPRPLTMSREGVLAARRKLQHLGEKTRERFIHVRSTMLQRLPKLPPRLSASHESSQRLQSLIGTMRQAKVGLSSRWQQRKQKFLARRNVLLRKNLEDAKGVDAPASHHPSESPHQYLHPASGGVETEIERNSTASVNFGVSEATYESTSPHALAVRPESAVQATRQDGAVQATSVPKTSAGSEEDSAPGFKGVIQMLLARFDPKRWLPPGWPDKPPRPEDGIDPTTLPEPMRDARYMPTPYLKEFWPQSRLRILLERMSQRREIDEERIALRKQFADRLKQLLWPALQKSQYGNAYWAIEEELDRYICEIVLRYIPDPIYYSPHAAAPDPGYHATHQPARTFAEEVLLIQRAEQLIKERLSSSELDIFQSVQPGPEPELLDQRFKVRPSSPVTPEAALKAIQAVVDDVMKANQGFDTSSVLHRRLWRPDYDPEILLVPRDLPSELNLPEHFKPGQLPPSKVRTIFADDAIANAVLQESGRLRREEEVARFTRILDSPPTTNGGEQADTIQSRHDSDVSTGSDPQTMHSTTTHSEEKGVRSEPVKPYRIHGRCNPVLHSLRVAMQRFNRRRMLSCKALEVNDILKDRNVNFKLREAIIQERRILKMREYELMLSEKVGLHIKLKEG